MRRAYPFLAALGLLLASVGAQPAFAENESANLAEPPEQGAPIGPPPRAIARLSSTQFPLIDGQALLERTASGRTAITVTVFHLEPGSTHVMHIHGGACNGPILLPLQDLVADHRGIATSFTSVPAGIDTEDWWIQAHGWQFLPSPPIACGKVEAPSAPPRRPTTGPGPTGPAPGPRPGPEGPGEPGRRD